MAAEHAPSLLGTPMIQAISFLGAAVLAVPVFSRLGLGAVLGYLCARHPHRPVRARPVRRRRASLHVAELGVVLLLFVIGLELQPSRLWALRRAVFGLGGAQVLDAAPSWSPVRVAARRAAGGRRHRRHRLSLSSTAFALQTLAEKKQLTTRHGRRPSPSCCSRIWP